MGNARPLRLVPVRSAAMPRGALGAARRGSAQGVRWASGPPDGRAHPRSMPDKKPPPKKRRAKTPPPRRPAATPAVWQPAYYQQADETVPARDWLLSDDVPDEVRRELLTTIAAVVKVGPPRFPKGTPRWSIMRKSKEHGGVDMSGICEARDKHTFTLYRLFCVMDRDADQHGLSLPSLVLLDGAIKPDATAMPDSVYERVDGMRHDYLATRRVLRADEESVAWWPDLSRG